MSYNELLGIGILEGLMKLISCNGIMKKNVTVILLCRTWLVEYYLSKGLVILEQNSKNLSTLPNPNPNT